MLSKIISYSVRATILFQCMQMQSISNAYRLSSSIVGLRKTCIGSTFQLAAQKDATDNTMIPQWRSSEKAWRPTLDDVERISWGKKAKRKGTGSRNIPHRLEHEYERFAFDQGRRKGYVEIIGSGWRSERRDAPLMNSYRNLCDAKGQACISLHKSSTGIDEVVVDLSPLRYPNDFHRLSIELIQCMGYDDVRSEIVEHDSEEDPWETLPIYKLPSSCVIWNLPRSEAKSICKRLSDILKTEDSAAKSKSRKPKVKHGKSRRSGGYGI